jgi:hypothetical protein
VLVTRKSIVAALLTLAAVVPATPASAAGCEHEPGCGPRCPLYVDVDPGDPLNGIPPSVTIERIPC